MNCITCHEPLTGKQSKFCSLKCKNQLANNKNQNYKAQQARANFRKHKLILAFGGKCNRCGYNKCQAALCFHHLRDKEFNLDSRHLSNRSWKNILKEADKCELLCANCHMEEHFG